MVSDEAFAKSDAPEQLAGPSPRWKARSLWERGTWRGTARAYLSHSRSRTVAPLSARPERGISFRDGGAGRDKKAIVKALIDAFLLKHDVQQKFA